MKFLQSKFDVIVIAFLFLIVLAVWIYTRDRDILLYGRDLLIGLFALTGIRRAAGENQGTTNSGDVNIMPPPADVPAPQTEKLQT